jgi:hypothetical protein
MLNNKVAVFSVPSDITDSEDKGLHIYPNTIPTPTPQSFMWQITLSIFRKIQDYKGHMWVHRAFSVHKYINYIAQTNLI